MGHEGEALAPEGDKVGPHQLGKVCWPLSLRQLQTLRKEKVGKF